MAQRTYTDLKKSMTESELKAFFQRIAKSYAYSDIMCSSTYYKKKENITESCFRRILKEAIVKNLVTDEEVNLMEVKAIANQRRHYDETGTSSRVYYGRLRSERKEYIISNFTDEEKKKMVEYYAESKETMPDIAKKYDVGLSVFAAIIKEVFVQNKIDDEICDKIYNRSLKNSKNPEKTKAKFEELIQERNHNK